MPVHRLAQQIAPHVKYEFDRLLENARELARIDAAIKSSQSLPAPGGDKEAMNRALECFLLHARNLYDFFFMRPRFPDDVLAEHFFSTGWAVNGSGLCPYLFNERERLNQSIQHLSYNRLKFAAAKVWQISIIVNELTAVWNSFIVSLSPQCQGWFGYSSLGNQSSPGSSYSPPPNLTAKSG
jgi:hypothetical protein